MIERLEDFNLPEPIFVDANVFLFHAFDDPERGESASFFLQRVENGQIRAVTTALVVDEVLFKILMQSAAAILHPPITIYKVKEALTRGDFRTRIYAPVRAYLAYLSGLSLLGLEIAETTPSQMSAAVEIGSQHGLLITDAAHLAFIQERGIRHIATGDADFEKVSDLTVWKP